MIYLIEFSVLFTTTVSLMLHTAKHAKVQSDGVAEPGLEPTWTSYRVGVCKLWTVSKAPPLPHCPFLSVRNDWITAAPIIYVLFKAALCPSG